MTLKIDDLEKMCLSVITQMRRYPYLTEIAVDKDYYWNIDPDERFNIPEQPSIGVGSIFEDIEYLTRTLSGEFEISNETIIEISNIFAFISNKISNSPESFV